MPAISHAAAAQSCPSWRHCFSENACVCTVLQPIMRLDAQDRERHLERFQPQDQSPRDIVGASLSAAFQAAADAAANMAGPMVSNWSHLTSAAASSLPVQVMTTQLQGAAAAGHSSALASMAMVSLPAVPSGLSRKHAQQRTSSSPSRVIVPNATRILGSFKHANQSCCL